jgi:DNA-directed RNA polymerase subunit RPC12/RpoP
MLKKIWVVLTDVSIRAISTVIAGAILTVGVGGIVTYLLGWWPYLLEWVAYFTTIAEASTLVPNLLLIPICLLAAFGMFRLLKALYHRIKPDWHNYKTDKFLGVRWHWQNDFVGNNPLNLKSCCLRCDTQIIPDRGPDYSRLSAQVVFLCENCGYRVEVKDRYENILRHVVFQIERRLRKMRG